MSDGRVALYECIDREHNAWRCLHCGHIEAFEADGPLEDDWRVCPHCALPVVVREEDDEDDEVEGE